MSVAPATESQCLPASGSFGLFVAESVGHLARAPTLEPKFEPSRSDDGRRPKSGRKRFDAIITPDGAGAGLPSRKVATSMRSSVP